MEEDAPPLAEVGMRGFSFANLTASLLLVGATESLYGPLLVAIAHRFDLSLPQAGVVLSVHFVGAVVGVLLTWIVSARFSGSAIVGVTLAFFALGALAVATASGWTLFLSGVFVVGLGFGGLDFTVNTLLTRTALRSRARRLSIANAGYGVGAVIGPLLVILVRPHNFAYLFAGAAFIALALPLFNRGLIAPRLTSEAYRRERTFLRIDRRRILVVFISAYVLYVAAETSASGWIASQLTREGYAASLGSLVTGGFWLGLALGRIFGGPLHTRFAHKALVLWGLGVATALALVASSTAAAPYAYTILGVALASVYPMGLIWYTSLCPHDRNGLALIILCMMGGGVVGPGAVSLMVSLNGIHVVPIVIAVLLALDLAVFSYAVRFPAYSQHDATGN